MICPNCKADIRYNRKLDLIVNGYTKALYPCPHCKIIFAFDSLSSRHQDISKNYYDNYNKKLLIDYFNEQIKNYQYIIRNSRSHIDIYNNYINIFTNEKIENIPNKSNKKINEKINEKINKTIDKNCIDCFNRYNKTTCNSCSDFDKFTYYNNYEY